MIIHTHSRALFAIAYGVLQNREEAEDVVQDALVKAWKTRWRVRDPEKFPAWLGTITRHRARDLARRRGIMSRSRRRQPSRSIRNSRKGQDFQKKRRSTNRCAPRSRLSPSCTEPR